MSAKRNNTVAFELAFEGRKNRHRKSNKLSLEKQLSLYPHESICRLRYLKEIVCLGYKGKVKAKQEKAHNYGLRMQSEDQISPAVKLERKIWMDRSCRQVYFRIPTDRQHERKG